MGYSTATRTAEGPLPLRLLVGLQEEEVRFVHGEERGLRSLEQKADSRWRRDGGTECKTAGFLASHAGGGGAPSSL